MDMYPEYIEVQGVMVPTDVGLHMRYAELCERIEHLEMTLKTAIAAWILLLCIIAAML